MQIIVSESHSPSFNLASEQFLLTERPCDVLFFYINDPCVVLGRNQNIYAEVNLPYCLSENIQIVRRLSGGGAVYHDRGNINFCFIATKASNPLDYNPLSEIVSVLSSLGVKTTVGTRKDLSLNQKKITGTAVHSSGTHVLLHGTLLYDTNLNALETALTTRHITESNAVKSVRSKVTNIRQETESLKDTDSYNFLQRLADQFSKRYFTTIKYFIPEEADRISDLQTERYDTWEWNWAQSPKAIVEHRAELNGETLSLSLTIEKGFICHAGDECPEQLKVKLLGKKLSDLF
jgi:lipoyltransferase and lipoate-protein ligase